MQLLFESLHGARRRRGPRAPAGRGRRASGRGLKLPHIGWNEVRWVAMRTRSHDGSARGRGLLPRAHLRAARRRRATTSSASASTARRSSTVVARHPSSAASSTPRSPRRTGSRCWRTSPDMLCTTPVPAVILYPAIDISDGKAVRLVKGDFDAQTVYEDSPVEAARAWVGRRRALPPRRRSRRRQGRHAASLAHLEQITCELRRPGPVRRRPALASSACGTRCAPAPSG